MATTTVTTFDGAGNVVDVHTIEFPDPLPSDLSLADQVAALQDTVDQLVSRDGAGS